MASRLRQECAALFWSVRIPGPRRATASRPRSPTVAMPGQPAPRRATMNADSLPVSLAAAATTVSPAASEPPPEFPQTLPANHAALPAGAQTPNHLEETLHELCEAAADKPAAPES